jgi:hypothetical protein
MRVQFEITLDDVVAFNRYAIQHSPVFRRNYWIVMGCIPVMALIVALVNSRSWNSLSFWLPLVAITIVLLIIFPLWYKHENDQTVIKVMRTGKNRGTLGKHTLLISEDGLVETTEVNESRWAWTGIERVEQIEHYIFIFVSSNAAHIIPKRAFASTEEVTQFYNAAKTLLDRAKP